MDTSPLFPPPDNSEPPRIVVGGGDSQAAANLARQKVFSVFAREPDVKQEMNEAKDAAQRSPHQQFMYDLSTSGKGLATIQTEWHNYYQKLSDAEKHQVWQEFYASQPSVTTQTVPAGNTQRLAEHKQQAGQSSQRAKARPRQKLRHARNPGQVKAALYDHATAGGQLKVRHQLQSLIFGLGMGTIVIFIFLFGFFNEVLIAPFIQPSRAAAATPIIVGSGDVAPTTTPQVIIPKINVEIPVDYSETSTDENTIENDLESGVVHYPTTVEPGQLGNAAFFGHSSNNIFNPGKYKFAFVLLHTLVNGDTFYLTYNDKAYIYKVISHTIVSPDDVGVLASVPGQTATATLITCDPPGTSINRLVVVGQQISPDPTANVAAAVTAAPAAAPTSLPGNGPTLWQRFTRTAIGKTIVAVVILTIVAVFARWLYKPLFSR